MFDEAWLDSIGRDRRELRRLEEKASHYRQRRLEAVGKSGKHAVRAFYFTLATAAMFEVAPTAPEGVSVFGSIALALALRAGQQDIMLRIHRHREVRVAQQIADLSPRVGIEVPQWVAGIDGVVLPIEYEQPQFVPEKWIRENQLPG